MKSSLRPAEQRTPALNTITLCGSSRSKCGYCQGSRAAIMSSRNPQLVEEDRVHRSHHPLPAPAVIELEAKDSASQEDNNHNGIETVTESTSSKAYSILASSIEASDYQMLLDRGWRRSGDLLYLPKNWECCCPSHPIRLDVNRFVPNKGHKKVLRNFRTALNGTSVGLNGQEEKLQKLVSGREKHSFQGRKRARRNAKDLGEKHTNNDSTKNGGDFIHGPCLGQVQKHVRDFIARCNILTNLKDETTKAVREYGCQIQPQDSALNQKLFTILEKYSGFKIAKIDKPKDIVRNKNILSCRTRITLSTTICAALHGTSRGKIDKNALGKSIVERIDINRNDLWFRFQDTSARNDQASNECITLESVTYHDKSGRINIFVQLNMIMKEEKESQMTDVINEKKKSIDSNMDMQIDNNKQRIEEVIASFIRRNNKENSTDEKSGPQPPYKLTVKSIPSSLSGRDPKVHRLYTKYQAAIHNDPDPFLRTQGEDSKMSDICDSGSEDVESSDELNCTTVVGDVWSKLSEEDFERLYQREYDAAQRKRIYKSYADYYRFLCSSPIPGAKSCRKRDLIHTSDQSNTSISSASHCSSSMFDIKDEDTEIPCGSYHQQYLINDKYLIAVGVIDILPNCISSVYAFYDPVVSRDMNLGKLTALYEIDWVKHAQRVRTNLKYYYLGYYIHSCQKMRYKAEYKPSDILCPVNRTWVDFEEAKKRLEIRSPIRHCCNLSTPGRGEKDADKKTVMSTLELKGEHLANLDCIRLSHTPNSSPITVSMLTREGQDILLPILREFLEETGFEVAKRCIIKLF